ncbi:hypothetical protein PanWU01x14_077110 [Parasponia andersonii]|uniref:Uncharacterized protein n=1 Tax=Parasponia andersonii TaxID=3476 RepID=A0A2P5DCI5_PARAD|nr:hypothetical protein PanWU01x14_077110 [Parasponia andersonii]
MGCCASTGKTKFSAPGPQNHQHSTLTGSSLASGSRSVAGDSRAPPPSVEEESVKEVLSETARPKTGPIPKSEEETEEESKIPKPRPVPFPIIKLPDEKIEKTAPFNPSTAAVEEISEVSEICSLSESVSAITGDDDEEVGPRVNYRSPMKGPRNRSYSGDLGAAKRERTVGMSPTRRSNQSPGRINGNGVGSVRLVQGREPGQAMMARRGLRTTEQLQQQRRDSGEGSARRSRSPATRSGAVGRSLSARRSAKSPGRAASGPIHGSTRMGTDDPGLEGKWPPTSTTDESLENPLVSLECFIFL